MIEAPKRSFNLIYRQEDLLWVTQPLPITVKRPRGKPEQIHLNSFINLGRRPAQNSMKKRYTKLVHRLLPEPPPTPYQGLVKFLFIYYAPDARIRDLSNMCAIVDKFTSDAVVEAGFIADDNTGFIQNVHYAYGGKDVNKFNHARLYIFKD